MPSILKYKIPKQLAKETIVYTFTDVVGKAMSFVLLPVVSFYMPPDELGIATNFTVITSLISLFAGLAVVNSLPYFFYEQEQEENRLMISTLLMLCIVLCGGLTLILMILHNIVWQYLQLSLSVQLLGVIYVIGMLISQSSLILMRLENKPRQFAYLQIFQIVFHAVVVLFFVIALRGGGLGKIYAETIVFVVMGIIHLGILRKKGYLGLIWNLAWMKKLLNFGLPLLPHSVSFWFKSGMDKVFITSFCGLQFNGLYSMAISISAVYTMLVQSFFNAYTPHLQKQLVSFEDDNLHRNEKKSIVKQTYLLFALFGLVGVLSLAACWFIFNFLIDPKYLPALSYMPIIILANYFYVFYQFTIQYIYKAKKTLIMGVITFSGSLIQMLLSYWLIREFGVMGAVYSLLIGNLIITIGISIYSNLVYPMPWFSFFKDISKSKIE